MYAKPHRNNKTEHILRLLSQDAWFDPMMTEPSQWQLINLPQRKAIKSCRTMTSYCMIAQSNYTSANSPWCDVSGDSAYHNHHMMRRLNEWKKRPSDVCYVVSPPPPFSILIFSVSQFPKVWLAIFHNKSCNKWVNKMWVEYPHVLLCL